VLAIPHCQKAECNVQFITAVINEARILPRVRISEAAWSWDNSGCRYSTQPLLRKRVAQGWEASRVAHLHLHLLIFEESLPPFIMLMYSVLELR
jgi:hypothetical protein